MIRNQQPKSDASPSGFRRNTLGRDYQGHRSSREGYTAELGYSQSLRPSPDIECAGSSSRFDLRGVLQANPRIFNGQNMDDAYAGQPPQSPDVSRNNDGHALEKRDRRGDHQGNVALGNGRVPSTEQDEKNGAKHEDQSLIAQTDPEELRQKVVESLAEKKRKAALFMNMEAQGVLSESPELQGLQDDSNPVSADASNPERDAAINALLKNTASRGQAETGMQDLHDERRAEYSSPNYMSPNRIDAHYSRETYEDDIPKPKYARNEPASYVSSSARPRTHSEPRPMQREYVRSYEEEPRLREVRYAVGPEDDKKVVNNQRYEYTDEDRRRPKADDQYRAPPMARRGGRLGDGRMSSFKASSIHGLDYDVAPEYASYPAGRYITPREDPRYPPVSRPPETDYAALYYRDLTEWLEITGYHDVAHRQKVLRSYPRHLPEDSRRYVEEDQEIQRYVPRMVSGEDADPRRARATSYSMPPPPPPNASWDERETPKRGFGNGVLSGPVYLTTSSPVHEARRTVRDTISSPPPEKLGTKRRVSRRDDDFINSSPLHKSARHAYDTPFRKFSSGEERANYSVFDGSFAGSHMAHRRDGLQAEEPIDETEAVRQTLSKRLAASHGRGKSPSIVASQPRRRSLSPRRYRDDTRMKLQPNKYAEGLESREPSPRFNKSTRPYLAAEEYRKPFQSREISPGSDARSLVESRATFDENRRGSFHGRGRGRGRGYKDHYFDRQEPHNRRQTHGTEGPPTFKNELVNTNVRYFMIKSFNQDNVKAAQTDNIWATQQKNADILEEAFKNSDKVILFFSINKSGKFQGYARMVTAPGTAPHPSWSKNLLWESSGPFRIHWDAITDISFHRVAHLKNELNCWEPVLIGRDGQEIDPKCGAALCEIFDTTAAFRKEHEVSL